MSDDKQASGTPRTEDAKFDGKSCSWEGINSEEWVVEASVAENIERDLLAAQSELAAMRERLSAAEELLREIRDGEVNAEDEADKFLRDDRESALAASRRANAMLREALERCLVGGNHLGLYKTEKWPDPEAESETALRILCATQEYDVWCCWRAIMNARPAFESTAAEHKAWEDALWGEPVAEYKQWIDEHGGQRGGIYGITPEQITPGTLFYAKPKGLI